MQWAGFQSHNYKNWIWPADHNCILQSKGLFTKQFSIKSSLNVKPYFFRLYKKSSIMQTI